jgi:hypothetical protein
MKNTREAVAVSVLTLKTTVEIRRIEARHNVCNLDSQIDLCNYEACLDLRVYARHERRSNDMIRALGHMLENSRPAIPDCASSTFMPNSSIDRSYKQSGDKSEKVSAATIYNEDLCPR